MVAHFTMYFLCHLVAIIQYHSFWFDTAVVLYYTIQAIWNGACFYMEYFAKKYELQLNELEKMQKDTEN